MINGFQTLNQTNIFGPNNEQYITQGFTTPNGGPSVFINQSLDPNNSIERYATDYYAGNQICIFLGGMWIADVTSIQFQLNQSKTPFYGYKSQLYDIVARGTKLVQGVFSINYIDAHYMNMIVAHYKDRDNSSVSNNPNVRNSDVVNFINQMQNNPRLISQSTLNYTASGVTSALPNNNFTSLPFNQKVDILKQYWWGQSKTSNQAIALSPDNLPTFDLTITYGGYPKSNITGPDEFQSSHTVKVLRDVDIINHQQMLAITGEPVQEIYTFIARDITSPITRPVQQLVTPAGAGTSTK